MSSIDWLWILHPALMVAIAYPLLGVVIDLARRTRLRRLGDRSLAPNSGQEHWYLGRALVVAVVLITWLALMVVILSKAPHNPLATGAPRLVLLSTAALGTLAALLALLRMRSAAYRGAFALLTWAGLLALGSQPEVWRLSDQPWTLAFWQSHYWGGVGLVGLLLFAQAARPEIQRILSWRRWHLAANLLAALIFVAQAVSGARDLLEIPLSWQQPFLETCNGAQRTCPAASPPAKAPPVPSPPTT